MCVSYCVCVCVCRSRWHFVGGPFAHDVSMSPHLFVLSPNGKSLVSGGHWDNSFRVISCEKGKVVSRVTYHTGEHVM